MFIILTLSVSFSNSGFFHFELDSIFSTTNPKTTTKTPNEFASRASAGSAVYGSVLLPFLPFLQRQNWLGILKQIQTTQPSTKHTMNENENQ